MLEDLEADYVLADADYDSKRKLKAAKAIGAEPVIASNPKRDKRKKVKHAVLLRTKRYVVEQFNGHIKASVLRE